MLDGLDEVAEESQRSIVSNWVNSQMEQQKYQATPFILTSRPHGYESAPLKQVSTVLEVLPFNREQIKEFVSNWYQQTTIKSNPGEESEKLYQQAEEGAKDLIKRILKNRSLERMATNPLLITMIARVHCNDQTLPEKRVKLYERIFELLLVNRQNDKEIRVKYIDLGLDNNKSLLQQLALALMKKPSRDFKLAEGEYWVKDELVRVAGNQLPLGSFSSRLKRLVVYWWNKS
jgi:predicted NACHT family NTPase